MLLRAEARRSPPADPAPRPPSPPPPLPRRRRHAARADRGRRPSPTTSRPRWRASQFAAPVQPQFFGRRQGGRRRPRHRRGRGRGRPADQRHLVLEPVAGSGEGFTLDVAQALLAQTKPGGRQGHQRAVPYGIEFALAPTEGCSCSRCRTPGCRNADRPVTLWGSAPAMAGEAAAAVLATCASDSAASATAQAPGRRGTGPPPARWPRWCGETGGLRAVASPLLRRVQGGTWRASAALFACRRQPRGERQPTWSVRQLYFDCDEGCRACSTGASPASC